MSGWDGRGSRSVDVSQPFMLTQTFMDKVDGERYRLVGHMMREELMNLGGGRGGVEGSAQTRHGVSFNCLSRMRAGDLIGQTGSPGIWELWRERGHVTSTHHQLSQILLAQLAGSGVISQFPKVPREISSPAGPSSKRTGDRFTG